MFVIKFEIVMKKQQGKNEETRCFYLVEIPSFYPLRNN